MVRWSGRAAGWWLGAGLVSALVLAGCARNTPISPQSLSGDFAAVYDVQAGGDQVFMVDMGALPADGFKYALDLRGVTDDVEVYMISTNTGAEEVAAPRIDVAGGAPAAAAVEPTRPSAARDGADAPVRDRPEVTKFNNNPPVPTLRVPSRQSRSSGTAAPRPSEVGDTDVFRDIDATGLVYDIPATVRATVAAGGLPFTLAVWVADESWSDAASTCDLVHCVTQPMVDAIAGKFLQAGADNDAYDWLTAVFGAPWGDHEFPGILISPNTDEIHILLFDIDGDESTTGGVVGFFFANDLYIPDPDFSEFVASASNERLLLYLDSVLLATPDDAAWYLTDYWPSVIVSTLAHEFQHLIHFYQKQVRFGFETTSETWLNEMSSEVAEDLIANKIEVHGPRGVAHTDGSAGERFNPRGRLPLYNLFNDIQVTRWDGRLSNYSINYALGAYLARTYGAALFTSIVQNDQSGTAAIEAAIMAETGRATTFGQVIANWAVANVLSDDPGSAAPYRYNAGDWITSTAGGVTFDLGSINLYLYEYIERLEGPFFHSIGQLGRRDFQPPHSNIYVDLGRHGPKALEGTIGFAPGTQITFVVKD